MSAAKHPIGYVELTVAMALLAPDGTIVNDDMADVTLAFGIRSGPPPRPLTEAEVREAVRSNLSRVAAMIEAIMIANGAVHMGQVDDPMTAHSREIGTALSDPVTVRVDFVDEARA